MQEKQSYIFTKILLVAVILFIGLILYASKIFKEEKEKHKEKETVSVINTPMPHPPLTQRDDENLTTTHEMITHEENSSIEDNRTSHIPQSAEYISPEEQLVREEANLSDIPKEEIYDDSKIIPQDEVDNYEDAVTIPINENQTKPTPPPAVSPISTNPFNNSLLGTPIYRERTPKHPTLGTPIGNAPMSPF